VSIRERGDDDLPACERLARAVRLADGYPVFLPNEDFRRFVELRGCFAAWVAEIDGEVVGQVALHPAGLLPVVGLIRSTLDLHPERLGAVSRLMVAPTARRRGVGKQLLEVAATEASRRGLVPILDVVRRHESAVALYENSGWTRVGPVEIDLPDGTMVDELVFLAPARFLEGRDLR
jgi:GNAT superfamily N-acetyltransferase